jgi:hypothetical protein
MQGLDALRVVVQDARRAIPALINALEGAGAGVRSIAESRPTFDDVFIRLIEQHDGRRPPTGRLQTSAAGAV